MQTHPVASCNLQMRLRNCLDEQIPPQGMHRTRQRSNLQAIDVFWRFANCGLRIIQQSCCWWMCSVSLALPRPRSRRKELHPRLAQLLGYEVEGIRTSIHQEMSWIRSWNWRNSSYVCKWQIETCSNLVNFHKKVSHMYSLMTDIIQLQTNVLHISYMWKTNF